MPRHSARVREGLPGDRRVRVLRPHLALRKPRYFRWVQVRRPRPMRALHGVVHCHTVVRACGLHSSPT
eukprot:scaffold73712_cov74-Phaeocystis_antarctica.AAC.1